MQFGDYIVYVDEAGDHGPVSAEFPVFVLAFCIFHKKSYAEQVLPRIHDLKFRYVGHDAIVLHEREIRKQNPPFSFLRDEAVRPWFLDDLNTLIQTSPFTVVAVVVDKRTQAVGENPYTTALDVGLTHVTRYLRTHGEERLGHVVVESRGKKEDADLRSAFHQFCSPAGTLDGCNLDLIFATKTQNHGGMQLADMIARPIGRHMLNPEQPNRAYEIIQQKFWGAPSPSGMGLHLRPAAPPARAETDP